MTSWLQEWGEPAPHDAEMGSMEQGGMDMEGMDMEGMDMEGMDMEGMDQEEVMAELTGLSGSELDRRFLELMIDHHRGAIEMAQEHLTDGENADARDLSRTIVDDQTAEITEMTELLGELD